MKRVLLVAFLLWAGVVAAQPAVYRGGTEALQGEIARKTAAEFIWRAERAHRRAATPVNGVRKIGKPLEAAELRRLLGGWLLQPGEPSVAVVASFTVSERGKVGDVRILQTPAKELGEVVAAALPRCNQWLPRREVIDGVKQNAPDSVVVRIRVVQIRDSLDSRIEARTKTKK